MKTKRQFIEEKTRILFLNGNPVKLAAGQPRKQRQKRNLGGRPKRYGLQFQAVLHTIWKYFDYQCVKLPAPLIRLMSTFLAAAGRR